MKCPSSTQQRMGGIRFLSTVSGSPQRGGCSHLYSGALRGPRPGACFCSPFSVERDTIRFMQDEFYNPVEQAERKHSEYIEERKLLIDAARESARTFDQAVLAFGSAIFGASIAFLKDVAPKPQHYSLKWLAASWTCFSIGLLGVMLSFLFSHRACMFEIETGWKQLQDPAFKPPKNLWSSITYVCNYLCVSLLFLGLMSWSVFACENLSTGESTLGKPNVPQTDSEKRGYVPPSTPPRTPPPTVPPSSPPPPAKK